MIGFAVWPPKSRFSIAKTVFVCDGFCFNAQRVKQLGFSIQLIILVACNSFGVTINIIFLFKAITYSFIVAHFKDHNTCGIVSDLIAIFFTFFIFHGIASGSIGPVAYACSVQLAFLIESRRVFFDLTVGPFCFCIFCNQLTKGIVMKYFEPFSIVERPNTIGQSFFILLFAHPRPLRIVKKPITSRLTIFVDPNHFLRTIVMPTGPFSIKAVFFKCTLLN